MRRHSCRRIFQYWQENGLKTCSTHTCPLYLDKFLCFLHSMENVMDAKITKLRLSRMLSYDWLKIVGTAAAAIVVWVLIFTMTATRITSAQTFTVANYLGNNTLSSGFTKAFNNAYANSVFTGEIIEFGVVDLTTAGDYAGQVLEARVTTEEGDVMFVSQQPNPDTAYTVQTTNENGETVDETKYGHTYLESFLAGYRWNLHDLNLENENSFFK